MDSLCLCWQEHSSFYACLCVCVCAFKIGGLVTVLRCRDPWEMLYIPVALQPLCSGQMAGERETESPSEVLACLTPPFPALKRDVFSTEPPNELLHKPKDFSGFLRA